LELIKTKQLVGLGILNSFVGWYYRTLISAVLLLFRRWRMAINRSAAMTIFSVIQAGLFQLFTWVVHG
jgi:hypothetical protein